MRDLVQPLLARRRQLVGRDRRRPEQRRRNDDALHAASDTAPRPRFPSISASSVLPCDTARADSSGAMMRLLAKRKRERQAAKLVHDRERLAKLEPGGSAERPIPVI